MTKELFDFAYNVGAVDRILWNPQMFLDVPSFMEFEIDELDVIASVPEEELPEKLRGFIINRYTRMGFLDEYEEKWTDEDLEDVRNLIEKYPVLKDVITFENGLTIYRNTAGYIDWA